MFNFLYQLPRRLVVGFIKIYQKTISFDHGFLKIFYPHGFCRFTPSCSEYGVQAITKYGVLKGSLLASWRVLRCNPWSKGGYDPLK
jgi:hypothetical protein